VLFHGSNEVLHDIDLPARLSALGSISAATATISKSSAAPAASAAFGLRTSLIHRERPPLHFLSVQAFNRLCSRRAIRHFDKSKAARLPRIPVPSQAHTLHRSEGAKSGFQLSFGRLVRQIAYVDV
jgi:hypothetical protein